MAKSTIIKAASDNIMVNKKELVDALNTIDGAGAAFDRIIESLNAIISKHHDNSKVPKLDKDSLSRDIEVLWAGIANIKDFKCKYGLNEQEVANHVPEQ